MSISICVMYHVIVTVSVSDTKQTKRKSSVSMDTTTTTTGETGDVQDLTPERLVTVQYIM